MVRRMPHRSLSRFRAVRGMAKRREPDLTGLINVVFLILVFFIVAGALRPFAVRDLELAKVAGESGSAGASALVIERSGEIIYQGRAVDLAELARLVGERREGEPASFTIVADARLDGARLLAVARALQAAGVGSTALMVERTAK